MTTTGSGPVRPGQVSYGSSSPQMTCQADQSLRALLDSPAPATVQQQLAFAVALERHLRIRDYKRRFAALQLDRLLVEAADRYMRLPDAVVDAGIQLCCAEYAAVGNLRLHGGDDLRSLGALRWLAVLLDSDGPQVRAEYLYRQVAEGYRRRGEPLMVLRVHCDLAVNLHRRGHCFLAQAMAQDAWDTWRYRHGDQPAAGAQILFCFAVMLRGCGDLGAAAALAQQAAAAALAVPAALDYGISDDAFAALLDEHRDVCQHRGPPTRPLS